MKVSVHAPVPAQSPLQPANVASVAACAERVIVLPYASRDEQLGPQSMPPPLTLPDPVVVTRSIGSKLAVAVAFADTVSWHGPRAAEQASDQPAKTQSRLLSIGMRSTLVPDVRV